DVEPIAVAAVLRHATLVGREQDRAGYRPQTLYLDKAQLSRRQVKAGHVVAEVLLRDVVDLPTLGAFVFHHDAHRGGLGLEVRLKPTTLRRLTLRMREHEYARESFHRLKRERLLPLKIRPTPLSARQKLCVPELSLSEAAFGARDLLLDDCRGSPDLLVGPLEQFRQRKLNVRRHTVNLGEPITA